MAISTTPVHQLATTSLTPTITAAASGNTLIVCIASFRSPAARTVSSIACTNTTGWFQAANVAITTFDLEIWAGYCTATSGTALTITMSGTSSVTAANISEWSGILTPSLSGKDITNAGKASSGTSATTNSFTPSASDIAIAVVGYLSGTAVTTQPGGSWGNLTGIANSTTDFCQANYFVPTTGSALAPTWTIPNVSWLTVQTSFKVVPKTQAVTGVAFTGLAAWAPSFTKAHAYGKALPATIGPTVVVSQTATVNDSLIVQQTQWVAIKITMPATYSVTGVNLTLNNAATPVTAPLIVAIQADSSGAPSGTDLASTSVDGSTIANSGAAIYSFPLGPVTLNSGSIYYILCSCPTAPGGSPFLLYDTIVGSGGNVLQGNPSSVPAWTAAPTHNAYFQLISSTFLGKTNPGYPITAKIGVLGGYSNGSDSLSTLNSSYAFSNPGQPYYAQPFVAGGTYSMSGVQLKLNAGTSDRTATITVSVRSTLADINLAVGTSQPVSVPSGAYVDCIILFNSPVSITSGQTYYIVVGTYDNSGTGGDYIAVGVNAAASTPAMSFSDGTTSWFSMPGNQMWFQTLVGGSIAPFASVFSALKSAKLATLTASKAAFTAVLIGSLGGGAHMYPQNLTASTTAMGGLINKMIGKILLGS